MDPLPGTAAISEFGRFTLLPYRRELLADGQPIGSAAALSIALGAHRCPRGGPDQGRVDGPRVVRPGGRGEQPSGPGLGTAQGPGSRPRSHPDRGRARLPVHWRNAHAGRYRFAPATGKVVVHRLVRWKILRQKTPLAAPVASLPRALRRASAANGEDVRCGCSFSHHRADAAAQNAKLGISAVPDAEIRRLPICRQAASAPPRS